MLRKFVLPVLALLAVPAIASAQFEAGDLELTLSGTASAPKSVDGVAVGVQGSLGYFVTQELEVSARQTVTYIDADEKFPGVDANAWGGSTAAAADFHFDMGAFQPFVGGYVGYSYPAGREGRPVAGPEVGVKYFANGTTFVYGRLAYEYDLDVPGDSFFTGEVGIGFRL